jgi:hypothetical protein
MTTTTIPNVPLPAGADQVHEWEDTNGPEPYRQHGPLSGPGSCRDRVLDENVDGDVDFAQKRERHGGAT